MHFSRIMLAAIGAAILLPSALAQTAKCATGQREHKDDNGKLWCMDSEGRSHEAAKAPLAATANKPREQKEGDAETMKNSQTAKTQHEIELQNAASSSACGGLSGESMSVEELYNRANDAFDRHDFAQAECWAQIGLKHGDEGELSRIGFLYGQFGSWNGADENLAFQYLSAAALKGQPFGELFLAELYARGLGTTPNQELSTYWHTQAMSDPKVRAYVEQMEQTNSGGVGYDDRAAQREEEEERYRYVQSGGVGTGCDSSGHCITRVPDRRH